MEPLEAGALLNAEIISGTMIHHGLNHPLKICVYKQTYENLITFALCTYQSQYLSKLKLH